LNKFYYSIKHWLLFISVVICSISICCTPAHAQKYNFTHYDIEDGLIQSQATMLSQDATHRLWVGTLGGACRFDGKNYFTVSKASGLPNNFIYAVVADKQGGVWLGTHKGLSLYKNNKVYNYAIPKNLKNNWVSQLVQDSNGTIWAIMDNLLFKITGKTMQLVKVSGDDEMITAIAAGKHGALYVAAFKKGIYALKNNKWVSSLALTGDLEPLHITRLLVDGRNANKLFALSPKGVFVVAGGVITPFLNNGVKPAIESMCLSIEQDADNNIWIGTGMGAYYFKHGGMLHFTASNGFTDNPITDIYRDADKNIWLATSGSGIFKYGGDDYKTYGQADGLKYNQVVMGVAHDKNNIVLGTDAGLLKETYGVFTPFFKEHRIGMVQSLYNDSKGNIWIGANSAWKYDGSKTDIIKGTERRTIVAFTEDEQGTIWMGTPLGPMYYQNNELSSVPGRNVFTSAFLPIGKDSVLAGTQDGPLLIVNKKVVAGFKLPKPVTSNIFCLLKIKQGVLIGTDDKGLLVWDRQRKTLVSYNEKHGLKSNVVYSLTIDANGIVWAGTGRGVNRIAVDSNTLKCTILKNHISNDPVVESNQNASLYHNNSVYIGTAKGLTIYNADTKAPSTIAPYVIIQSIKFFKGGKMVNKGTLSEGDSLQLPADQNHLAISFLGVYLKNPQGVTYQYKLSGMDDKFSQPVANDMVDYPSLPPGKYTFEVKAISPDGVISKNTAKFNFEIVPPFYQRTAFRIFTIIFIVLLIIVLQNLWHSNKKKRELVIERIKREEKLKIRQQTAEDFHDDLGNKLTRITVLSEMLNVKIDKDKPDQQKLVEQIKQNAASLYNGTKDILWALDPKSDNLYETLKHIEEIGQELFRDTAINFNNEAINEDFAVVKLTMEYNRNITMIFKELMNNVLKHADAKAVSLKATRGEKNEMCITLTDDGKGFDAEQTAKGHGLKNVKTRAGRINGDLLVTSVPGTGTNISLKFTINTKIKNLA
jgi:signal transduction histidine kinase/ligand-binding sensor domain-containing protein